MSRLVVQHWIACLESVFEFRDEWLFPYNLLGVSYSHTVPADTEFPCVVPRPDLFARFFNGRRARRFEVGVYWLDGPTPHVSLNTYGLFTVFFSKDQAARNYVFRLQNIPLPGPGRYRLDLRMSQPARLRALASEFFEVLRTP